MTRPTWLFDSSRGAPATCGKNRVVTARGKKKTISAKPDGEAVVADGRRRVRGEEGDQVDVHPVAEEPGEARRVVGQPIAEELAVRHGLGRAGGGHHAPCPHGEPDRLDRCPDQIDDQGTVDGRPEPAEHDHQQGRRGEGVDRVDRGIPPDGLAAGDDPGRERQVQRKGQGRERQRELDRSDSFRYRVARRTPTRRGDPRCATSDSAAASATLLPKMPMVCARAAK